MNFSCLISCYHKESPVYLREALQSISNQTLQASEIVFVEDGKLTQELYDVLDEFKNKLPFKFIKIDVNRGLGYALSQGLQACSNEIVMRMDADDVCVSYRFEMEHKFMVDNPDIDIVGAWSKVIDQGGKIIGERKYPTDHASCYKLIWTNPIIHPSVAFKKDSIISIGSYNEHLIRKQDYDLWFRAADKGLKFANIPEFLLYYRITSSYHKKNDLKIAFQQAIVGIKGVYRLKLPLYVYFAVFYPVIKSLLPSGLIKNSGKINSIIDPRSKYK